MVSKLLQSTIDPDSFGTTVTGAGGFGKTFIATALCHHPVTKEEFKDGIVFIELGPQATDPSMKLSQLYHLLTGHNIKQGDVNYAEQEINQLTSLYCRNLLVIIDDVWHVEDAEPIVKAFSNCKIVLTTRMNDIEQYIPTKQVVSVGPMKQSEAISLLTSGVIDISQLLQEDVSLLDELAQDVHLWPLLLSLLRGQLSHNLKLHQFSYHETIQRVQAKLHDNGLIAFDKNNIEKSRKFAVKICIEATLELLPQLLIKCIKILTLFIGIGTSVQTVVLHKLWNITDQEANDIIDQLWAFGLIQFSELPIPSYKPLQHCVEVHSVISQYIFETMDSVEVCTLSPFSGLCTVTPAIKELSKYLNEFYTFKGKNNVEILECQLSKTENYTLPLWMKSMNCTTLTDPHLAISFLQNLLEILSTSTNVVLFLPLLHDQINSLIKDCHKVLRDAHSLIRNLNRNFQRCLSQRDYETLVQVVEDHSANYPIRAISQQAVKVIQETLPYCEEEEVSQLALILCEGLKTLAFDYSTLDLALIPHIKSYVGLITKINGALIAGPPQLQLTCYYVRSKKILKEIDFILARLYSIWQENVPNWFEFVKNKLK